MTAIDIDALSRTEKSILLYAETCLVDLGGLLESQRMNADDIDALKKLQEAGLITFGRIPFHTMEKLTRVERKPTHWVTFSVDAWQIAHALRRQRAAKPNNSRAKVDEAVAERTEAQTI